jgi:uncharacterized protein YjeT (DUF2065 family)
MTIALIVVAFIWIILGIFLIIYTSQTRRIMQKVFSPDDIKPLAVIPAVFGIVLVIGAFYHKEMFWLALILGLIAILKGVYLFTGPVNQIDKILDWWFNRAGEVTFRLCGLILFTLGLTLLSYLRV